MTNTKLHSFPWSGSQTWDVDVLVVGGGPAGISAVTRLRWMKTMNPIPLSVVLANSGPLGGLAKLGNSILTGPSLAFPAGELVRRLKKDLEAYPVPIIEQKAVAIQKTDQQFTTTFEDGSTITSLAVILACGMLDLRNIQQFWQKGVSATFGNRANIIKILQRELPGAIKPLLLGGIHLLQLQQTIIALNPDTQLLIDCEPQEKNNIIWGNLDSIEPHKDGMMAIIHTSSGEIRHRTDRIILEFNSLELNRTPLPKGLLAHQDGYLKMAGTQGLYSAGDCSGPPFSAIVALGEGAKAGLEAYQYVHQFKYGSVAPLFAYYGDKRVTDEQQTPDDYLLQDQHIPVRLLQDCPTGGVDPETWICFDGKTSISQLKASIPDIYKQVQIALQLRAISLCSQTDQT